jgi:23S rRNA (pseudouridine1915-N3)-methyltransferase
VKVRIAWIGRTKDPAIQSLTADYLRRIKQYADVDALALNGEEALLKLLPRTANQPASTLVALDRTGEQMSSEELAHFLERHQNTNPQPLLFAVGAADGLSRQTLDRASVVLSLGKITLPHELARVVLLEQIYRGFTILKGHPYHTGH